MNTIIKKTAVVESNGYSAIANAAKAGLACMAEAGISASEVGLLINAGVYRDDNIMEPSIASLIQKELSMGLDLGEDPIGGFTFSFDVVNGACGFLNAAHIADSFLKNNSVKYALIVAGDAHPSKTDHATFPFVAVGAAALMTLSDDDDAGFTAFSYKSDGNTPSKLSAAGRLSDFGKLGREIITFNTAENSAEHLKAISLSHLQGFLLEHKTQQVDFYAGSDIAEGFAQGICDALETAGGHTRGVSLFDVFEGDIHTAAPIVAFDRLDKELKSSGKGKTVVFSSVGSGDSSACALYRMQ